LISEDIAAVGEFAVQNKQLNAGRRFKSDLSARLPAFDRHHFMLVLVERHDFHACPRRVALIRALGSVDAHLRAIGRIELPQLHENRAARLRARRVRGGRRIAHVGTGRIVAMLVLEHAFEHEELFATRMCMAGKM